jgi:isocitrate/isopropylmalate dehydrogenase
MCKKSDAVLFGAVTTPPQIEGYFSPIVRLRKELNLYANIRPFVSLPIPESRQGIDIVLFRENTECLYAGNERKSKEGAITERIITAAASRRILTHAFSYAMSHSRSKVTVVHKANVMRLTDGLFLEVAHDVTRHYPEVEMEEMLVDACAMRLVQKPEQFDVIVTTNMFGDILSDLVAGLTGGLGVAASANVGEKCGLFEPVHGSAPKYEGKNHANPTASFFSTALMLDFLGEDEKSGRIRKAVIDTIQAGKTTKDLGGSLSMTEFTDEVIRKLEI